MRLSLVSVCLLSVPIPALSVYRRSVFSLACRLSLSLSFPPVFLFAKQTFRKITDPSLSVCVCLSLASNSSETVKVIVIKLGTVTASDMRIHHMLIILTLTFIQGHIDLNGENNNCFRPLVGLSSNLHTKLDGQCLNRFWNKSNVYYFHNLDLCDTRSIQWTGDAFSCLRQSPCQVWRWWFQQFLRNSLWGTHTHTRTDAFTHTRTCACTHTHTHTHVAALTLSNNGIKEAKAYRGFGLLY